MSQIFNVSALSQKLIYKDKRIMFKKELNIELVNVTKK